MLEGVTPITAAAAVTPPAPPGLPPNPEAPKIRRCFACGSADHIVLNCTDEAKLQEWKANAPSRLANSLNFVAEVVWAIEQQEDATRVEGVPEDFSEEKAANETITGTTSVVKQEDSSPSSLCFTQQMAAAEVQEAEQLISHSLDPADPIVGELPQSGGRRTPDGAFPISTTISDTTHLKKHLAYAETQKERGNSDPDIQPTWIMMAPKSQDDDTSAFAATAIDSEHAVPAADTEDADVSPEWTLKFQDFWGPEYEKEDDERPTRHRWPAT
ncbi:hypothetical protein CYMTET_28453 [Cymbomonas tetramitiformis]|uniref:Uncharacterized protein n=1 Tax=Cymbomonas tetramitiformis TaxID=36881 RepID=A0AAE0FMY3_9CHLO|nr:hypothetical protein CYMTET_28453 [Cymbomonas tetramitiformis]